MEETKTKEEENKTALQLKKFLTPSKKQDLGDKSRWEKIPVEYIITANTLGIELNDHALKRLNEAEGKREAFEAIYVAQHFSKKAIEKGMDELAEKLEAIVANHQIKTEDIGLYALESVKGTIDSEELEKKLLECYKAGRMQDENCPELKYPNKIDYMKYGKKKVFYNNGILLGKIEDLLFDPITLHCKWLIKHKQGLFSKAEYYELPIEGLIGYEDEDKYVAAVSPKKTSESSGLKGKSLVVFGREYSLIQCDFSSKGEVTSLNYKYTPLIGTWKVLTTAPDNIEGNKIINLSKIRIE
ncbi:MAG: hypothetical protein ABIB71_02285 [Candidatus Woesearchaeota archaeon]